MRLHAGEAVLLRLHVHDDLLQALRGQHAEAQVDGLGEAHALVHVDPGLDAVVELVDVDLQAGDEVRADDLVAVHLEVGDVVALDVAAEVSETGEQLTGGLDLVLRRRAHSATAAISPSVGRLAWSQQAQLSPK